MIKIEKPARSPKTLIEKGKAENKKHCIAYKRNPDDYESGWEVFEFKEKIYRAQSVKKALLRAQHNKCCYCESEFLSTSYGAVEHYRPKGAVRQAPRQSRQYPGYYWLAYDWDNLLFSCTVCNTMYKRELFPLTNDKERARNHNDNIERERPLFINPAIEDPRKHIRFRGATPSPRTKVGRETIKGMGLRRNDLVERRRRRLQALRTLQDFIELGKDSTDSEVREKVQEARERLAASVCPNAEYSSMAQDFLDT